MDACTRAKTARHRDPLRNMQTESDTHTWAHTCPGWQAHQPPRIHKQDQTHTHTKAHTGVQAPTGTHPSTEAHHRNAQIPILTEGCSTLHGCWACGQEANRRSLPCDGKSEPQRPAPTDTPVPAPNARGPATYPNGEPMSREVTKVLLPCHLGAPGIFLSPGPSPSNSPGRAPGYLTFPGHPPLTPPIPIQGGCPPASPLGEEFSLFFLHFK